MAGALIYYKYVVGMRFMYVVVVCGGLLQGFMWPMYLLCWCIKN